jgi:hypothetical protein
MLKMLWSHTRSIDVSVFSDKVVYRIPLYSDFIFKNAKIEYCQEGRELKLTTYQEPTKPADQPKSQSHLLAQMDF